MNIAQAIMHLFPQANPMADFIVQDDSDGNGPYVAIWNLEGEKPTEEELQTAWDAMQPTSADLLMTAQIQKKQEISDAVSAKIVEGYQSTVVLASTGRAHFYGTTLIDQQNMTASRVYATANPAENIKYRPQDVLERVVHTHDEFVQISDAVLNRVSNFLDQGYALSTLLVQATTPEEVNGITVVIL